MPFPRGVVSYFFPFLISICFCLCYLLQQESGKDQRLEKEAGGWESLPKCDWERGRCTETKGGQEQEKSQRSGKVEREERDGAPDLTTLTHSGLFPCQLCIVVDSERTRSYAYILIHACWAMGAYLACVHMCVMCV